MFKSPIQKLLLTIDSSDENHVDDIDASLLCVCQTIFTLFNGLTSLVVDHPADENRVRLSFNDNRLETFCSSNLLNLKISVERFSDCLGLFDGRFSQLRYVCVNVGYICDSDFVQNEVCFSMHLIFSKPKTNFVFRMICLGWVVSWFPVNVWPMTLKRPFFLFSLACRISKPYIYVWKSIFLLASWIKIIWKQTFFVCCQNYNELDFFFTLIDLTGVIHQIYQWQTVPRELSSIL